MWTAILSFFLNIVPWGNTASEPVQPPLRKPIPYGNIAVGDHFSELPPAVIKDFNKTYHYSLGVLNEDRDNCGTFTETCKLDYIHYFYFLKMGKEQHIFKFTFSINFRILAIEDTYTHQQF